MNKNSLIYIYFCFHSEICILTCRIDLNPSLLMLFFPDLPEHGIHRARHEEFDGHDA